jgi:hypothetical protein
MSPFFYYDYPGEEDFYEGDRAQLIDLDDLHYIGN